MELIFLAFGSMIFSFLLNWIYVLMYSVMLFMLVILKLVSGFGSWEYIFLGVVGWDNLSLIMSGLTVWICMLSFMMKDVWFDSFYKGLVLFMMFILILCFCSLNLLLFYIYFEFVLIPMFLLVLYYGVQPERLESVSYMMFYTIFGSLPFLVLIIYMYSNNSSWSFMFVLVEKMESIKIKSFLLILAFLIKMPMYGFHIWLPKAHVEASTVGSMILAGVFLKLGGYGLLRVSPFLDMSLYMTSYILSLAVYGSILCGLLCLRQLDMKSLVAYSSVVHSGLMFGGFISYNYLGWMGGVLSSVGHGFTSSGLFYFVSVIYSRVYSRSLLIVKGVLMKDYGLMLWCFLLVISNMAAPPFLSVFSEVFISMGMMSLSKAMIMIILFIFFFSVAYSVYFYSILAHGKMNYCVIELVKVSEYLVMFLHLVPMLLLLCKFEIFLL